MLFNNSEIDRKVKTLMEKMTLDEKVGQMVYIDCRKEKHEELIREGKAGTVANVFGAAAVNEIQKIAVEESRLSIPLFFGNDVIHGYKTIFPIPLAESCSWDTDLIGRTSQIAAAESSASGTRWIYSPMLDIARDPRWGRIYEGTGEDTYLASVIGKTKIAGLKSNNDNMNGRVISCAKHFAAYGACEGGRDYNTVDMSENTLRQVYLPPFKACIDAGVETVMTAFNDFNGIPVTANKFLVTDILRKEWGFDGIVVNDYFALLELLIHGAAATPEEACRLAVEAGVDMDMNSGIYSGCLAELVKKGLVSIDEIDRSVYRILYFKYWLGLFENPYTDVENEKSVVMCERHLDTAREAAAKSMVLLKNEKDILPLNKNIKSIAVIGPLADDKSAPLGFWCCNGDARTTVTVLEGIKNKLGGNTDIHYAKGCEIEGGTPADFTDAVEIARKSEVAVVIVGESANMSGEARCRSSLDLPGIQEELVKAIHATGTPVVAVLINGRPLSIPWLSNHVPAILEAWLTGVQTGNAVADILFGDCCPSGKLTVSFPRSSGQVPVYYNRKNTGRPAGISPAMHLEQFMARFSADSSLGKYLDYVQKYLYSPSDQLSQSVQVNPDEFTSKYLDVPSTPLYPFGYGLSYTSFEYTDLKLGKSYITMDEELTLSVKVKNTGKRPGEEVVQLYIRDLAASITRPVKELKGFKKVCLMPGEEREIEFVLGRDQLGFYNKEMKFVVEPGAFMVWVGPDSVQGLEEAFTVVDGTTATFHT